MNYEEMLVTREKNPKLVKIVLFYISVSVVFNQTESINDGKSKEWLRASTFSKITVHSVDMEFIFLKIYLCTLTVSYHSTNPNIPYVHIDMILCF